MIRRGAIGVVLFIGMVAITAGLWRITPGSLVPDEDQGYYIGAVFLPDGATLQRTDKVVGEVLKAIQSNHANEYAIAFTGLDFLGGGFRNNAATIFVTQKHWDERKVADTRQLVGELFMKTGHIKEALVLAFDPPPIFGLGNAGGFEFYIQNRGEGGPQRMAQVMQVPRGRQQGSDAGRRADAVARQRAAALGRCRSRKGQGARRAAQRLLRHAGGDPRLLLRQRLQQVRPHLAGADVGRAFAYRKRPDSIGELYVRSDKGGMVPVRALASVRYTSGPDSLDRFNNLPAVKLFGQGAPGVSSGQAIQVVEKIADQVLPRTSATTGAALRSRRRSRAAPRRSRWASPSSWCS